MKTLYKRIPVTLGFIVCFLALMISATYRGNQLPVSGKANNSRVVVIDAGHGGLDSGCVGVNGCYEKDINLTIAKTLAEMLEFSGFSAVLTRTEDVSIHDDGVEGIRNQKLSDMENRRKIVVSYPESIFLSIHQNQFTEPQYFGAQMFYNTNNRGNFTLARIMQSRFAELQPDNNREIKLMDKLYLFEKTEQPALLIECGFLSNSADAEKLSDSDYQKDVAFTIYSGLMDFLAETEDGEGEVSELGGALPMQ